MDRRIVARRGAAPALPDAESVLSVVRQAMKQVAETVAGADTDVCDTLRLEQQLDFTQDGITAAELGRFLEQALGATAAEPTVETGNVYGVSSSFHRINSELLMAGFEADPALMCLPPADRDRALALLEVVFRNPLLRNRNCLHPSKLDSAVIGNLLQFPKHIFGLPFASHATTGIESLSLCLFSYRQEWEQRRRQRHPDTVTAAAVVAAADGAAAATDADAAADAAPVVLYLCPRGNHREAGTAASAAADPDPDTWADLRLCALRLGMEFVAHESPAHPAAGSGAGAGAETGGIGAGMIARDRVAVVLASLAHPALDTVARWCAGAPAASPDRNALPLHLHVRDRQWRAVFARNPAPVHVELPAAVRSVSIEQGLLRSGYSLYRDAGLRDLHLDVGYGWQTVYGSPNEGGSGASAPLFVDFCTVMLGWRALRCLAGGGGATAATAATKTTSRLPVLRATVVTDHMAWDLRELGPQRRRQQQRLDWDCSEPLAPPADPDAAAAAPAAAAASGGGDGNRGRGRQRRLQRRRSSSSTSSVANDVAAAGFADPSNMEDVMAWGVATISGNVGVGPSPVRPSRTELEAEIVRFQCEFIGGKGRQLEAMTTCGGTRSITLGFEAVMARTRATGPAGVNHSKNAKVLIGNPHLAVERAARRLQFGLVRLVDDDGALCPTLLAAAIADTTVVAVYTQTLSYTDGTTDPLDRILAIVEAENKRRAGLHPPPPVITLLNDCCLAFSVLVNDNGNPGGGSGGGGGGGDGRSKPVRLLDMSRGGVTPVLVTIDAHKHLGADKGISTVVGTPGTLTQLDGALVVGGQPRSEDLTRCLASLRLIGRDGYLQQYTELGAAVAAAVDTIKAAGMTVLHARNRYAGSTVIAVEDPGGVVARRLKKRGHKLGVLFNLAPTRPSRCQTGWQFSVTPHSLRLVHVLQGRRRALDVFLADLAEVHREVQQSRALALLWSVLGERSLLGCLLTGDVMPWALPQLHCPGLGRQLIETVIRRYLTAQLDCGTICAQYELTKRASVASATRWLLMAAGAAGALVAVAAALLWPARAAALRNAGWAGALCALRVVLTILPAARSAPVSAVPRRLALLK